jgi:hypothetical protein
MGSEISSLVAAVEVQRATAAFWAQQADPEPEAEAGAVRRAAKSVGRALTAAAVWARGGRGVGAQTGTAPRGA